MTGQMTLEQTKTVLLTNRILSQTTEARLRYKRVDFLGTADFESRLRGITASFPLYAPSLSQTLL